MKTFEYADQEIGSKDLAYIVSSMMIGVGVLTLPRLVANHTNAFDGWISILCAGLFFLFFGWFLAKMISAFPKKTFFEYTTLIMTKPVAVILTVILGGAFLLTCSLEARVIANISKLYMFDQTPIEAVALAFLLVVIYAVSGSRIALLRLNLMFLPIVILITLLVQGFNITLFQVDNLRPTFSTTLTGYFNGAQETTFSFTGYVVILVYISLMNKPKDASKMTMIGIGIPIVLYLIIYTVAIAVFGHLATAQITYPTIEVAKEIEAPGGFVERFESIFFTVWIMTVFNTTSMAMDIAIHLFRSVLKISRKSLIYIISPIIYLIGMTPENTNQIQFLGKIVAYLGFFFGVVFPLFLYLFIRIKGVKYHA
jgi:spore germination protein